MVCLSQKDFRNMLVHYQHGKENTLPPIKILWETTELISLYLKVSHFIIFSTVQGCVEVWFGLTIKFSIPNQTLLGKWFHGSFQTCQRKSFLVVNKKKRKIKFCGNWRANLLFYSYSFNEIKISFKIENYPFKCN